jgi:hypothetical protein
MAVRDDKYRPEIHRALQWVFLDSGKTSYLVACGIRFESNERRPVPLSSGYLLGACCSRCFGHLPKAAAA